MDDETRNTILNKFAQSQQSYAKGMEMVGLFSAGTIGVVVALRPDNIETLLDIKIAIVLLFISMIGTIIWFMGKGKQYFKMASKIWADHENSHSVTEPLWARASRVLALASFICAYWLLFGAL